VDILITKDGLRTLMDVIIVDLIHTNMVQQALTTTTRAATMVAQKKTRSYVKQAPGNDFIPFAIETYGCFHFCFDLFFIACHY